ncbi:MAG: hypothetical protein Q8N98_01435, partial [bacterium]|nr:hypothetical protein [bacterium]
MKIGIDISQIVHPGGVAIYTKNLVKNLLKIDKINNYILFGSSLRKLDLLRQAFKDQYIAKFYPFPPTFLEFMFNKLRIPKIEFFTGYVDVFHTS